MDGEAGEPSTSYDVRSLNTTQTIITSSKPSLCNSISSKLNRSRRLVVFLVLALVFLCTGVSVYLATLRQEECILCYKEWINIHLVPHSHDDVGWLRTPESYYEYSVKYILNNVIHELEKNPRRKFVYVETYFFWRWWNQQSQDMQDTVKRLVSNGQLEFAGGGWTMNDEAVVNYQGIIDQFTWGLRRLNDTFGTEALPTVGWQIDTFGHSRETASLFRKLGFNGVIFARIDEEDRTHRKDSRSLEFLWEDRDGASSLLTSVMYKHYNPPSGFHYEKENKGANLKAFLEYVREMANAYRTPNILIPMGDDFTYYNAKVWYENMDSLIRQVENLQSSGLNVNMFYSTPKEYMKALQFRERDWPVKKNGDMFPYSSDIFSYWSGYFTSRPSLKYFERIANNVLQMSKQLLAMGGGGFEENNALISLREAVATLSHHDALTGTAKQKVNDHYIHVLYNTLQAIMQPTFDAIYNLGQNSGKKTLLGYQPCLNLNISECPVSETSPNFVVTAYNTLSWNVSRPIRLPVRGNFFLVRNDRGDTLPSQVVPIPPEVQSIPGRRSPATVELVFQTGDIPPHGFTSFYITALTVPAARDLPSTTSVNVKLSFHPFTNQLSAVTREGYTFPVLQEVMYYHGSAFWSGAYVFRPVDSYPYDYKDPVTTRIVGRGPVVEEYQQRMGPWASQVIRVYDGFPAVEIEWLVGPIPVEDFQGKEVIIQYTSSVQGGDDFYTDTNGRGTLRRRRNKRDDWHYSAHERISGNYYPVTSHISVRGKSSQMFVVTDRPQGGASIRNGQLELMVHRRLCYDDGKGVNEPLNETAYNEGLVVRGRHWLLMATGDPSTERIAKRMSLELQHEPFLLLAPVGMDYAEWQQTIFNTFHGLSTYLPQNVRILTLEPWRDGLLLLRLEHIYEKYPETYLSKTVVINLRYLFTTFEIVAARETGLGADRWLPRDWIYGEIPITLNPTDIRTFLVQFKPRLF